MNKQTIDLGFILKQFPEFKFTMSTLDDRIKLQKFIYLFQSFGIYLGYDFSWYIHGPFCSTLSTCGFALQKKFTKIPDSPVTFENVDSQHKFKEFHEFIKGHEDDLEYLEISASLHYQHNFEGLCPTECIDKVITKYPEHHFDKNLCEKIWSDLKKWKLV